MTTLVPHWIACAPVGVPSSGPSVVATEGAANEYREMGWGVSGPYVLASEAEVERLRAGLLYIARLPEGIDCKEARLHARSVLT